VGQQRSRRRAKLSFSVLCSCHGNNEDPILMERIFRQNLA
jgi:hypothetical protein